ncbi:Zn-ribbon domain-containing OB-fold protein [Pseudonocardia sp. GCM10023141]|uniref:Zn-ribbon domain-containing OB-fold protein n=1 Tax=Pseudonocardia sp. GCM10023141 TaxID=3252653 RepID=UPI0036216721
MSDEARIAPGPTAHTDAFWAAAARNMLVLARCPHCGVWLHPQCETCPHGHIALVWTAASGHGIVVAAATVHRPAHPARPAPYVVLVVRLDEGPQLIASQHGPGALRPGDRVRAVFDGTWPLVRFTLDGA